MAYGNDRKAGLADNACRDTEINFEMRDYTSFCFCKPVVLGKTNFSYKFVNRAESLLLYNLDMHRMYVQ